MSKLILPHGATELTPRTPVKFLTAFGTGPFSHYKWPLPTSEEPGEWVEVKGTIRICERGLHYCALEDAIYWLQRSIYPIEIDLAWFHFYTNTNKGVAARARLWPALPGWDAKSLRGFLLDCVEHAMKEFTNPTDSSALRDHRNKVGATLTATRHGRGSLSSFRYSDARRESVSYYHKRDGLFFLEDALNRINQFGSFFAESRFELTDVLQFCQDAYRGFRKSDGRYPSCVSQSEYESDRMFRNEEEAWQSAHLLQHLKDAAQ